MSRLTAICLLSFVALNNQAYAADDGGCPIKYIENGKISGTQNEADFNTMKAVTRVFMERYFGGLGAPKIEVVIPSRDCAVLSGAQFKHDLKLYRIPDTQCTFQLDTSDNLMFGRINFGNLSGEYKTEVSYYNNWSIRWVPASRGRADDSNKGAKPWSLSQPSSSSSSWC